MKKRAIALLCALALVGMDFFGAHLTYAAQADGEKDASGATYYVSSIHGDNSNSGTSENAAWETLDKLIDLTLEPGDQILLEKGSVFQDSYIHLQDVHGTAEAPIRISSYGTGAKPSIHANGQGIWYQQYGKNLDNAAHKRQGYVSSTILLYDVDFVEVSDLELTNISDDFDYFKGAVTSAAENSTASSDTTQNKRMDRTGVAGIAKNGGTMEHVYLDNLYIHDVDGNIGDKHMDNGGIQMNVAQPDNEEETGIARYHDVKITNCYVRDVSRAGICVGYTYQSDRFSGTAISEETAKTYGHTDLIMENNYVKDVGNDGIVAMYAYRPLVQNNVADRCGADMDAENGGYSNYYGYVCAGIWPWKCKEGLFQYNEGFDTVNNQDGMPWDIDSSDGTIYQYNYSHNNGGGCIMFCLNQAYNGTFRYNISQNDLKGFLILSGNPKGEIYNNIFYVDGDLNTKIHNPTHNGGAGVMRNNIFYNASAAGGTEEHMDKANDVWSHNIFYGYDDRFDVSSLGETNLSEDPKFVDPGKAPTSILLNEDGMGAIHDRSVYNGYKLQEDSPAINSGVYINDMPDADFFGNQIGLQPDIGAFESDTNETEFAFSIRTRGESPLLIKETKRQIRETPKDITAGELKKQLICAKGSSLAVTSGEGNQSVSDETVVDETMKVTVTSGSDSQNYSIILEKDYWEYEPESTAVTAGNQHNNTDSRAENVVDKQLNTLWHTSWSGCNQNDVWLKFDLGEIKDVAMVKYISRASGVNGIFEEYKVEVSENGTDWTEVDRGIWSGASGATEYSKFDQVRARYVKLSGLETASDSKNSDGSKKIFGSAAEVRIGYEGDGVLTLRAKEGSGLSVENGVIADVTRGMTVAGLKEKLIYSAGAVLSVQNPDGGEIADAAVVRADMQVKLTKGEETLSYAVSFLKEYKEYGLTGITATAGSSQANQGPDKALDNDTSTLWHTSWNGCSREEVWIQLDLGEVKPVSMVKYVARASGGVNGIFEAYEVQVSADGTAWEKAGEGTWPNVANGATEYAKFDTKQAKYVKLIGAQTKSAEGEDRDKIFGTAAEIRVGYESDAEMTIRVPDGSLLTVTDDEIKEVPKETTAQALKEQLIYPDDAILKILGMDNQEVASDAVLLSGMKARIARGEEVKEYTIKIQKKYEEYDRSSMTAEVGSSYSGQGANNALDGNINTLWHTNYTDTDGCRQDEVWIKIDLGEVKDVAMVKYVPRQSGAANGIFVDYKVQVSSDGASWTDVDSGTWSGALATTEYAKFDTVKARYVKLIGERTVSTEAGKIFGTAAEIRIGHEVTQEE